jgi:N-acetylmuramoyl-L-alanine amidase
MKICIDPGHGMDNRSSGVFDPGATHVENGVLHREADVALRYGLTLKDALRARGFEVFMTRDDNEDRAPVRTRAAMAMNAGCDLLLSLHMNDFEDDEANGTETLYRGAGNRDFARRVQGAVTGALDLKDRGLKERTDLAVLKFNGAAALIELGFIANDKDRERIASPDMRSKACQAVAAAVQAGAQP